MGLGSRILDHLIDAAPQIAEIAAGVALQWLIHFAGFYVIACLFAAAWGAIAGAVE